MANSTSEAVGDAAKAAVVALGLTRTTGDPPATTAVPVTKRKEPSVPQGDPQGLPQFVVSVGDEGKTEYLTATRKLKTYPVAVTIVTNGGAKAGDDPLTRQWRQQIELALEARATWRGMPTGFNEVNLTNKPPFDVSALSKDLNYTSIVAEVQIIETRG